MELNTRSILLLLSTITMALSAGLFYGWVVSVIPGTRKITDQAYLETMQSVNKEILNTGFFLIFFGSILFLLATIYLQYKVNVDSTFYLLLSAAFIYLLGTIGVTFIGNIPLNNVLEAMDLSTFSIEDFKNARANYEESWNRLNLIRTVAAVVSFVLILIAGFR